MSTGTSKAPKARRQTPGVATASFLPGCFSEFTDTGNQRPSEPIENGNKKLANGKTDAKKKPNAQDRRNLNDIEVFLNNCLNLANALETNQADKIIQLLREARERAVGLRG